MRNSVIEDFKHNIQKGVNTAEEDLRDYLKENGTPLIEKIEGDDKHSAVTFIYDSEEEIDNVLLLSGFMLHREDCKYEDYTLENIEGTNFWHGTFKIRNDIKFSYTYFPNDSLKEEDSERWGKRKYDMYAKHKNIMKNNGVDKVMSVFCVMPDAPRDYWVEKKEHGELGEVQEVEFHEEGLDKPRIVRIYTPYGYDENSEPYGFLLVTDGNEHLNLTSSGVALDNLIHEKKIPPVVGIFIDWAKNRREELTCNDEFCEKIIEEILPWVRENYNISDDPKKAVVCGSSLGGLTGSYIGLKYSHVIGNILSQSGSYWYKPEEYQERDDKRWMISLYEEGEKLPLKFYLNYGVLESASMKRNVEDYGRLLREKGYEAEIDMFNSGHDAISWGEKFADGLISLIGK